MTTETNQPEFMTPTGIRDSFVRDSFLAFYGDLYARFFPHAPTPEDVADGVVALFRSMFRSEDRQARMDVTARGILGNLGADLIAKIVARDAQSLSVFGALALDVVRAARNLARIDEDERQRRIDAAVAGAKQKKSTLEARVEVALDLLRRCHEKGEVQADDYLNDAIPSLLEAAGAEEGT